MKTDTDQLIQLVKNVRTYKLNELNLDPIVGLDLVEGVETLRKICTSKLSVPMGTVLKVAELENLLGRTNILVFVGSVKVGNIVVCIDQKTLELERVLYDHVPCIVGGVRSISFPVVNTTTTLNAITQILKAYKDMVTRIRLGLIPHSEQRHTLLNYIFEYALTGKVITEYKTEHFD